MFSDGDSEGRRIHWGGAMLGGFPHGYPELIMKQKDSVTIIAEKGFDMNSLWWPLRR
jgi:hypothetical protein